MQVGKVCAYQSNPRCRFKHLSFVYNILQTLQTQGSESFYNYNFFLNLNLYRQDPSLTRFINRSLIHFNAVIIEYKMAAPLSGIKLSKTYYLDSPVHRSTFYYNKVFVK